MRKLLTLLLILNIHLLSYGVYLENVPYQLTQPNGEVLNVFITGDEFYRRVHDSNGYSIVSGNDGWYYYAMYDAVLDDLIPSEFVVTATQRTDLPMEKGLGISHKKYMEIRREFFEPAGLDASGVSKNSLLNNLAKDNSRNAQQMNNIIICIGFADTKNMTNGHSYVDGMFNSNPDNNLNHFFNEMSYGKLDIVSHFYPQPNVDSLRFYKDPQPRNYYRPWSDHPVRPNPIGYHTDQERTIREQTLVKNAIQYINAVDPVPQSLNLDIDNNGRCDFITFVVVGEVGGWNDLLWPHKTALYTYDVSINDKRVYDYNFELDASPGYFNVGTFCHEGYHVLGAPDLYHYYPPSGLGQAVGSFDIMDATSNSKPQSMSAYMKYQYGRWVPQLPVATVNQTYQVFPFYTNDGTDPEKPVIHHIPMSNQIQNNQYSVVEYRKRAGTNYDASLPNEGLMIYRIHPGMVGNAGFDAEGSIVDEVFLYRPESYQEEHIYSGGNLSQAPYNPTSGKTEFNSTTDPRPRSAYGPLDEVLNINNIVYHEDNDSYTFYYGDPSTASITLNKDELEIGKQEGALGAVNVISNTLWYVSIPENVDWLSVSEKSISKGINNDRVIFTSLKENNTGARRSATVTFTGYETSTTLTVIQDIEVYVCEDEVSNLNVTINKEAQSAMLTWSPPSSTPAPKGSRSVLWDNTETETGTSTSIRWAGGAETDFVLTADDFNITEDVAWSITEIACSGKPVGSHPLPDFMGISIYKDDGNNRPQEFPIWKNERLTPVEGIISGKMTIVPPEPIVLYDKGKYWISIYGTYLGTVGSEGYAISTIFPAIEERMCMWDPNKIDFPNFPDWTPAGSGISNSMYFSLTGEVTHPDRLMYNIYLNDQLIAADYRYTTFEYPAKLSQDNKWCVVAVCTSSMEGIEICQDTEAIIYDFNVTSTPLDGGAIEINGFPGHGEKMVLNAFANDGYTFANWSHNGKIISTNTPFEIEILEDMNILGNFEFVIPFDTYAVVKWNNTLMLNIKQLELDGYDLVSCRWYKSDELIGEGYSYSAGNNATNLLETGAAYTFILGTFTRGNVHSTEKLITEEKNVLKVYPNPVAHGNKLTMEGTVEGDPIEVYNAMGACVLRTTATGNVTELALVVPAGIYLVRSNHEGVKVIIN